VRLTRSLLHSGRQSVNYCSSSEVDFSPKRVHQPRSYCARNAVCPLSLRLDGLASSIRALYCRLGSVRALLLVCCFSENLLCSIGNLLGERKARRAGISAYTSLVLSLAISALWRCDTSPNFVHLHLLIQSAAKHLVSRFQGLVGQVIQ